MLIIGGGVTGLGTAVDLGLRGVSSVLVEMGDFCSGTTGRNHGMLHSGARYAVKDGETARECISESRILHRVVPSALEDTGGLFVLVPGDDPSYTDVWLAGCRAAGVPVTELPPRELARREPLVARRITAAFEVPDAVCYTMRLCGCLVHAAREGGTELLDWHRFDSFVMGNGSIAGGLATDLRSGEVMEIRARVVVNAAGAWGAEVLGKTGLDLPITFNRGAMLAFEGRLVNSVVQRLRRPSDFDALMPRGRNCVAGTTGVPTTDPGDRRVEAWEKERIREEVSTFVPALKTARLVHAWSGVRPLYDPAARSGKDSRSLSRRFEVLDHGKTDGVPGLFTVVGGKLATYRLMAEKVSDAACRRLGNTAPCTTASTVLCAAPMRG